MPSSQNLPTCAPSFPRLPQTVITRILLIALVVGLLFWWFEGHGARHLLWGYAEVALIYSTVFGLVMGLTMPYLGPRLGALRSPWTWMAMVLTLVILTIFCSLIICLTLTRLGFYPRRVFWNVFEGNVLIGTIVSLIIGFSITGYERIRHRMEQTTLQLRTHELDKERALKQASEAQLASLESRIHPHFLFNTMNSISALIREDPERAERMVQRLSALLRFSLDSATQRLVPLALEMKIVRDYLDIEKERLGDRLTYELQVPGELANLDVPPLAVQTLVENSIKYAIVPARAGGTIRVTARSEQEKMLLEVWDSGPGFGPENLPRGRGLDTLQARLLTLFGDGASLSIETREKGSAVIVSLPQVVPQVAGRS